jgi:hypothetical protein
MLKCSMMLLIEGEVVLHKGGVKLKSDLVINTILVCLIIPNDVRENR